MNIVEEIKKDVTYFKNLGFDILASKFERDLNEIQSLQNKISGDKDGK